MKQTGFMSQNMEVLIENILMKRSVIELPSNGVAIMFGDQTAHDGHFLYLPHFHTHNFILWYP
jgi:hypothetical protein